MPARSSSFAARASAREEVSESSSSRAEAGREPCSTAARRASARICRREERGCWSMRVCSASSESWSLA